MKEITIKAPEGYTIDSYDTTTGKITFKPEHSEKKWENFGFVKGYYINNCSKVDTENGDSTYHNKNTYPTKELAEAALALSQLLQWRDKVNEEWKPDWKDKNPKYIIAVVADNIITDTFISCQQVLAFKSKKVRDQFLKDHKTLLETAKLLL